MSTMTNRYGQGYTLIELLIAVSIFSALSLAAYSALDSMSRAHLAGEDHAESLAELQWVLQRFESDMYSLIARPRFDGNEATDAGDFVGQANGLGGTRSGWANPLDQPRAQLQRFQYQRSADGLVRVYWPTLYGGVSATPQVDVLSETIEQVSFRYFSPELGWQTSWVAGQSRALPLAIEMTLAHPRFGSVRRMVVLQ